MEWKRIASMAYRKIVFHSMPYHALSTTLANNIAHKVNLPVFFCTLNTISCFILSRDVEAEVVEAVKFLWKRKWKHLMKETGSGSELDSD